MIIQRESPGVQHKVWKTKKSAV